MAFTHLQPAEPTTVGYPAQYAQDLLWDLSELETRRALLCGKGFKGALGPVLRIHLFGGELESLAHFQRGSWTDLGLKRPWLRRKQHPESKNIKPVSIERVGSIGLQNGI